jgi:hypothetical protein
MANEVKTGAEQINDEVFAVVDRYLQARLEYAEATARSAEEAFAAERDLMLAFQRDGALPDHVVQRVSMRTHDAATEAGTAVLAERAPRSVFDQAKAARDALDAWLSSHGLRDDEETGASAAPSREPDEKLARQMIFQYLAARIETAREAAGKAQASVESACEEHTAFRRDRQISAEWIEEVWSKIADAVADVGMKVLEGHANRSEFDEAKANRTAVLGWIREQGFRVDTSSVFMAELPD